MSQRSKKYPIRRYALMTAYCGTAYSGWQVQKNAPSVQGEMEKGLRKLLKQSVRLAGCSRTDAGVHARRHVSCFDAATSIPVERLPLALSTVLPPDIVVQDARIARNDFDPRHMNKGKRYRYFIWNHPRPNPFLYPYAYHEPRPLDVTAMRQGARVLRGRRDYRTFRAAGFETVTSVRTLYDCHVEQRGSLIIISVRGDAFLYNMVRIIAGTLLYFGLGKLDPSSMHAIIQSHDRTRAGKTLAAKGLFLDKVYYPEDCFLPRDRWSSLRGEGGSIFPLS